MIETIVALGVLAYKIFNDDEKRAYSNFKSKRRELERTLEEHESNIREHIDKAQESYDFHFLTDLHYSSMKIADSAYKALGDAKVATDAVFNTLRDLKNKKTALEMQLIEIRLRGDGILNKQNLIERIHNDIKNINQLRKDLFPEKDALLEQQRNMLEKVRSLNNQTRRLKECIRDKCGSRGLEWYQKRLANKKSA